MISILCFSDRSSLGDPWKGCVDHGAARPSAQPHNAAVLPAHRQLVACHPAVHRHRQDHPDPDESVVPEEQHRHGAADARAQSHQGQVLRRPRDHRRQAARAVQAAQVPSAAEPGAVGGPDHHPVRIGRRHPRRHRPRRSGHGASGHGALRGRRHLVVHAACSGCVGHSRKTASTPCKRSNPAPKRT